MIYHIVCIILYFISNGQSLPGLPLLLEILVRGVLQLLVSQVVTS